MNNVKIPVPASSANVGLGYDVWCLGLAEPQLWLTYTERATRGIEIDARSTHTPPSGRKLGYAGASALQRFLLKRGIDNGAHLLYEDTNYPVGGLGRSGAEAVGAVMAAAVIYDLPLTRTEIILESAVGEPGQHKDNVAASTNGRFNIIAPCNPTTGFPTVKFYEPPSELGIAIGISAYQKTGGTEEGRNALKKPVEVRDFVDQMGLVSLATAAFIKSDTNLFLQLVLGDRFHQPRRARTGFYGNFDDKDFGELQKTLFNKFGVALNISGAGPNIQLLYNKSRDSGIVERIKPVITAWFAKRGIEMKVQENEIAKKGAYDSAQELFGYAGVSDSDL